MGMNDLDLDLGVPPRLGKSPNYRDSEWISSDVR